MSPKTGLYPEVRMSSFDTDITVSLRYPDVLRLPGGPEADPNNMNKAPSMGLLVPWISGGGQPSYRIPTYRIRGLNGCLLATFSDPWRHPMRAHLRTLEGASDTPANNQAEQLPCMPESPKGVPPRRTMGGTPEDVFGEPAREAGGDVPGGKPQARPTPLIL